MKSDELIMYILEISLIIFLLCCIIFSGIFTRTVIAIILLVYMIINRALVKSYKARGKYNKKLTVVMMIIAGVYLATIYILGIYIGFYNATVKFSMWSIINYILPYIVIIISAENIRKTILLKEDKKSQIVLLIVFILLDIAITTNIYDLKSLTDYYMLIGFIMFASIANNLLFNQIITKYRNCKAIIIYRLITTLYVYIIPIVPNIHILFESILRIVLPYIIYLILEKLYSKKEKQVPIRTKTKEILATSILIILVGGLIMLISCQFRYGILVIGSGSMTGTINKGDAIIYERQHKDEEIKIGDIIVFYNDKVKVIHRVIDKKDFGNGIHYYTKGDANPNKDEGYRTEETIIGKVKLRVPYIGQLTIMLNEFFE